MRGWDYEGISRIRLSINEIIDESFTAPLETPPDNTSLPYLVSTPVGTCHARAAV